MRQRVPEIAFQKIKMSHEPAPLPSQSRDVLIPENSISHRRGFRLCHLPAYVLRFGKLSSLSSSQLRAAPASACMAQGRESVLRIKQLL